MEQHNFDARIIQTAEMFKTEDGHDGVQLVCEAVFNPALIDGTDDPAEKEALVAKHSRELSAKMMVLEGVAFDTMMTTMGYLGPEQINYLRGCHGVDGKLLELGYKVPKEAEPLVAEDGAQMHIDEIIGESAEDCETCADDGACLDKERGECCGDDT